MAGFLGLGGYEKEGPGIEKNAPKKNTFIVFFETFFRNISKFTLINLVYCLIYLPIVTNGLACVGITHIARNTARDKHSFGLSDFFETIKKNWKQSLIAGIINAVATVLIGFSIWFYGFGKESMFNSVALGIVIGILFIFTCMQYYIWTMLITFDLPLKKIYENSFKFVFINFKKNLLCFVSMVLIYGILIGGVLISGKIWPLILVIAGVIYVFLVPGFRYLLIQFCTFSAIKKFMIDPYYEKNPDADIEKRRDLGLEVPIEKRDEESEEM